MENMEHNKKLSDIMQGDTFSNVCCLLSSVKKQGDSCLLRLSDTGGALLDAYTKNSLYTCEDLNGFVGTLIRISGLYEPGLEGVIKPKLKIKSIEPVTSLHLSRDSQEEESGPNITDYMLRISDARVAQYISQIRAFISSVGKEHMAYRYLLEAFYPAADDVKGWERLSTFPATHVRQASPLGGMLHASVTVTDMAYYQAHRYLSNANGVFSFDDRSLIDWDLLITGGLLHLAGNILYYEPAPPHNKSIIGVESGFMSCRERYLMGLIYKHNIDISEEELSSLFGIMARLNEQQNGIKKCRQEAAFLYGAYISFLENDCFDYEVSELIKEENRKSNGSLKDSYFYSDKLGCYVSAQEKRRKVAVMEKYGIITSEKKVGGESHAQ